MARCGVVGIVVENRNSIASVNALLSEFNEIMVGRMGVPDRAHNIHVISLIVMGSNEKISALTGKLGKLDGVQVKSALTSVEIN